MQLHFNSPLDCLMTPPPIESRKHLCDFLKATSFMNSGTVHHHARLSAKLHFCVHLPILVERPASKHQAWNSVAFSCGKSCETAAAVEES